MNELLDPNLGQYVHDLAQEEGRDRSLLVIQFTNGYIVSLLRGRSAYATDDNVEVGIRWLPPNSHVMNAGQGIWVTADIFMTLFDDDIGSIVAEQVDKDSLRQVLHHVAQLPPLK